MPGARAPKGVRIETITIPGPADAPQLRLRLYQPETTERPTPALLWLHGGGYVMGRPKMDDPRCLGYARELGITVASVDYRLAPRHPFPAALDDAYAALQWLAARADALDLDPERIAVGGASAGGGLAAALAQLARDRSEVRPAFQFLIFPMLDDRTVGRADLRDRRFVLWNQRSNRFAWEAYLGGTAGGPETPEYAAPARRADLSGLPPAWIGVGTEDLFYAEGSAYAQRLRDRGVDCTFEAVQGAYHGFDVYGGNIPIVRDFRAAQLAALKRGLGL
ncbi:alpha/beta hydrolase [bacterium]|nr:alpha/beta hydrolase [bacterium]